MNSFTKGLLTGVFGVVVGLVISGSNYQDGQLYGIGIFQISSTTDADGLYVFETILDTRSGRVVSREMVDRDLYKRVKD